MDMMPAAQELWSQWPAGAVAQGFQSICYAWPSFLPAYWATEIGCTLTVKPFEGGATAFGLLLLSLGHQLYRWGQAPFTDIWVRLRDDVPALSPEIIAV